MKIVIEQKDLEGPERVFDELENFTGAYHFVHEFVEWWSDNHSGPETVALVERLLSGYEESGQDKEDKKRVREGIVVRVPT